MQHETPPEKKVSDTEEKKVGDEIPNVKENTEPDEVKSRVSNRVYVIAGVSVFLVLLGLIGYFSYQAGKKIGYEGADTSNIFIPVILSVTGVVLLFAMTNFLDNSNRYNKPKESDSSSSDTLLKYASSEPFSIVRTFVASIELLTSLVFKDIKIGTVDNEDFIKASTDREKITKKVVEELKEKTKDYIISSSVDDIRNDAAYLAKEKYRHELFIKTSCRLEGEISSQSRRGVFNLSAGIITAGVGIYFLYSLLTEYTESKDYINLVSHFIPRVSLVILIEVFAYFFLNLYKRSLDEIKYFQNELTNIEMKYMALKTATDINSDKVNEHLVKVLIETERNRLLKKNETTVELEQYKMDKINNANVMSKAYEILGQLSNKDKNN